MGEESGGERERARARPEGKMADTQKSVDEKANLEQSAGRKQGRKDKPARGKCKE